MREGFLSISEWLRPAASEIILPEIIAECDQPIDEPQIDGSTGNAIEQTASEVRRFRAALVDALDVSVEELLNDIACDVVCRELQIAPIDVRAIVDRAKERFFLEDPVSIHVHPDDFAAIKDWDVNVICDSNLRRGDVVMNVRKGTIDASLGARLESIITARSCVT